MDNKVHYLTLLILLVIVDLGEPGGIHTKGLFGFLFGAVHRTCLCRCGVSNAQVTGRTAKMLGGQPTAPHEFPWMAQIFVRQDFQFPGVLISDRHVLTAASRIIGHTPYEVKVSLGVHETCAPDVTSLNVSVTALSLHPLFDISSRAHDVALLKLTQPVSFSRRILPICLPNTDSNHVGQVATVATWFEAHADGTAVSTCRPRKAGLPILATGECLKTALDAAVVTPDKNCLGIIGSKSIICKGDSGMGVMSRTIFGTYELIGVMTDAGECDTQSAALYTRLTDQLPWIMDQLTFETCLCLKI